jgi:hypothetical protein
MSHSSFSRSVPCTGAALCSAGSLGPVPPLLRSYAALRLPASPPRSLALAQQFRLPTERTGSPKVPWQPSPHMPRSSIPVESTKQASGAVPLRLPSQMLPSTPSNVSASTTSLFRDCIPRPACSRASRTPRGAWHLSTLRGHGCPSSDTYDHARLLPVGGHTFTGRELNPLGCTSGFVQCGLATI